MLLSSKPAGVVFSPLILNGGMISKGPCKQLTNIVEKISDEMTNVDFVSLDIEEAVNVSTEFSIRSVPQMYILKDGKVVSQKVGASDYNTVSAWIKDNV